MEISMQVIYQHSSKKKQVKQSQIISIKKGFKGHWYIWLLQIFSLQKLGKKWEFLMKIISQNCFENIRIGHQNSIEI